MITPSESFFFFDPLDRDHYKLKLGMMKRFPHHVIRFTNSGSELGDLVSSWRGPAFVWLLGDIAQGNHRVRLPTGRKDYQHPVHDVSQLVLAADVSPKFWHDHNYSQPRHVHEAQDLHEQWKSLRTVAKLPKLKKKKFAKGRVEVHMSLLDGLPEAQGEPEINSPENIISELVVMYSEYVHWVKDVADPSLLYVIRELYSPFVDSSVRASLKNRVERYERLNL